MKFGDLLSVPVIVTSNYLVLLFYFGQLCYNAPTVIVLSTSILYTSKQQRNSYKGPITNTLLKLQQVPKRGTRRRRVTVREQEAQLPQRNSASAAHMEGGLAPPAHSPAAPSGYTYAYGRIRNPQQTYVKRAVHKAHFKMNQAFKVIQGHPYWSRQESRMVCCRNVQLIPTLFLKLTKILQRENGKFVDFNDLT